MKNLNRPAPLCGVSCKRLRRPCKTVQSTHPRGVRHLFEHGHQLRQIISTHAPREGCDLYRGCLVMSYFSLFQSPHPVRGATGSRSVWRQTPRDFNPRTPRGVRRLEVRALPMAPEFQSTHPARGATGFAPQRHPGGVISIHAPREGCDSVASSTQDTFSISIHAPREGCDQGAICAQWRHVISIHAPREGCDPNLG